MELLPVMHALLVFSPIGSERRMSRITAERDEAVRQQTRIRASDVETVRSLAEVEALLGELFKGVSVSQDGVSLDNASPDETNIVSSAAPSNAETTDSSNVDTTDSSNADTTDSNNADTSTDSSNDDTSPYSSNDHTSTDSSNADTSTDSSVTSQISRRSVTDEAATIDAVGSLELSVLYFLNYCSHIHALSTFDRSRLGVLSYFEFIFFSNEDGPLRQSRFWQITATSKCVGLQGHLSISYRPSSRINL